MSDKDTETNSVSAKVRKSDAEWRNSLTPEQYAVTRQKGTEHAFTGEYYDCKKPGTYTCVCCGAELFNSEQKFDSGTGWPSFWAPTEAERVRMEHDGSHFMRRTEVLCSQCDAHLGHVFEGEGYEIPTDQRWCINSVSLTLEPAENA